MKKLITILFLSFVITNLFAQKNKLSLQADITAFDNYVQKTMQDWQIPGMAVAIVKNNEIIFSKGYGVREFGTNKKVDSKTIFVCASTTKAMTAACMGILVDAGKIKWSDPVIKYLPQFKLYDP
jgi:CubicO group peptidase (beta-lactamase class C family)